jgi:lipopolysaccharide transport system permease protein
MEIRITPANKFVPINFCELWSFKDLFLILCWRNISVRYKQTVLGVLWVVLQPTLTAIVFYLIFNRMANIQSGDGSPYILFIFSGLVFWQYFSNALTNASNSLIENTDLIKKVYFPRLIIPMAAVMAGLVDFLISWGLLLIVMLIFGFIPKMVGLLLCPLLVLITVFYALGFGLILAGLNVKYRDIRYALPFFIQILIFLTPVIYPVHILSNHPLIKTLMIWLNPLTGILTTARSALLGYSHLDWGLLGISTLVSLLYFILGMFYFRQIELYFADII